MIHTRKHATTLALALICFTGITSIAWKNNAATVYSKQSATDTVPGKQKKEKAEKEKAEQEEKEKKIIIDDDIDKALEDVERAQKNLENQMQKKNLDQLQRQIDQAMNMQLNDKKMQENMARAMKQLDMKKIQMQVEAAQQQINWKKMQADLQKAQQEIASNKDMEKLQAEIQENVAIAMEKSQKAIQEMKALDMDKIQREMAKADANMQGKRIEMKRLMEKAQLESLRHQNIDIKKQMEKAQLHMEKAKEELLMYKEMLGEMEKDGLLKSDQPYKIEYKKGELIINDVTQPENVTEKYKHYFKGDNFILQKDQHTEHGKKVVEI